MASMVASTSPILKASVRQRRTQLPMLATRAAVLTVRSEGRSAAPTEGTLIQPTYRIRLPRQGKLIF